MDKNCGIWRFWSTTESVVPGFTSADDALNCFVAASSSSSTGASRVNSANDGQPHAHELSRAGREAGWTSNEGMAHGTDTKIFGESGSFNPADYEQRRKNGIPPTVTCEQEAVTGSPDLGSLTTSHIKRCFLTVRQQLKRFQRQGLSYSKDLRMH